MTKSSNTSEISPFTVNLPTKQVHDLDKIIVDSFQPHLILLHSTSKPVEEKKGEAGNYFVSDIDLGNRIDVVFCYPYRIHAKKTVDGRKALETFDENSETYRKIAAEKTNMEAGIMIKFGVSLLGYLPTHSLFFIYHPSTKTSRLLGKTIAKFITPLDKRTRESDKLLPCTNIIRLFTNYRTQAPIPFWEPKCDALSMDHFEKQNIPVPPLDKVTEQIELFMAPTLLKEEEITEGSDR